MAHDLYAEEDLELPTKKRLKRRNSASQPAAPVPTPAPEPPPVPEAPAKDWEEECRLLTAAMEEKSALLALAEAQVRELKAKLAEASAQQEGTDRLNAALVEMQAQVDAAVKAQESAETQAKKAEMKVTKLESQVKHLVEDLAKAETAALKDAARADNLQSELEEEHKRCKAAERRAKEAEKRAGEAETRLQTLGQTDDSTRTKLRDKEHMVSKLQSELSKEKAERLQLAELLKETSERLLTTTDLLEKARKESKSAKPSSSAELSSARKTIREQSAEIAQLKEALKQLEHDKKEATPAAADTKKTKHGEAEPPAKPVKPSSKYHDDDFDWGDTPFG